MEHDTVHFIERPVVSAFLMMDLCQFHNATMKMAGADL